MNKYRMVLLIGVALCQSTLAQDAGAQPARPSQIFSNLVKDSSAWTVVFKTPREIAAEEASTAEKKATSEVEPAKLRDKGIKRIESSYSSGLRMEVLHYGNGKKLIRYLKKGMVLFEDPETGAPRINEPEFSSTGKVWGVDRMDELRWVENKFYDGVITYRGKVCYVFRTFFSQVETKTDNDTEKSSLQGVARNELHDARKAVIQSTAYIDKQTMLPVALETRHQTLIYEMGQPFTPFTLPASLSEAVRKEQAETARRIQRYNIPQ